MESNFGFNLCWHLPRNRWELFLVKLNYKVACFAARYSKMIRAGLNLQKKIWGSSDQSYQLISLYDGKPTRVSIIRSGVSLRECVNDFSVIANLPTYSNIEKFADNDSWIYVFDLFVPKELRKKGIGSHLMDQVSKYADESACDLMLTITKPSLSLHNFYTRNGFEPVSPVMYYKPCQINISNPAQL